jgi:Acyl-coenzyme A:6-aminopenicillanic acid acyl-transferase
MSPERVAAIPETVRQYMRVIREVLPGMAEELAGLAEGAEIDLEAAYLLQLRRELLGYRSLRTRGDCTTFARLVPGSTVVGQTIDLHAHMMREFTVTSIEHASGRKLTLASFTGLLGYLGMNDSGLCIGLNLVLAGEWQCGIPGYMAIRYLLDEASSVDQAIHLLRRLPLASSRALTLCDGRKLVSVEYVLSDVSLFELKESVHTNHFLHPAFTARDELNPFSRTSSLRRLDGCAAALARLPTHAGTDEYFATLEAAPIYVPPSLDPARECTVGSVVMWPELGITHVRRCKTERELAHRSMDPSNENERSEPCPTW